jgi:diacylglycerol kinase (ATP)
MESRPAQPRQALMVASPFLYKEQLSIDTACLSLGQHHINIKRVYNIDALDGQPPIADTWRAGGVEMVIAAGGDGTIGAVATHLAGSELPLGILPLGTSNDFARSLRLPLGLEDACEVIAAGHARHVDLGCAQPAATTPYALHEAAAQLEDVPGFAGAGARATNGSVTAETRRPQAPAAGGEQAYFTHALTLGLNVAFAQLATDATMRERFGRFTYPIAALETLSSAQMFDVTLRFFNPACALASEETETDIEAGKQYHYQALQVAVINSPVFGGQFQFAISGVELHDQLLDVFIIERFDLRQLLAVAQMTITPPKDGRREAISQSFPGIRHVKARQVLIETAEPADVTLDGELRGRTPMLVTSTARALKVIVPPATQTTAQSGGAGG